MFDKGHMEEYEQMRVTEQMQSDVLTLCWVSGMVKEGGLPIS